MATTALLLSSLDAATRCLAAVSLVCFSIHTLYGLQAHWSLVVDYDGHAVLTSDTDADPVPVRITPRGFRSAALLILQARTASGHQRRLVIWRDSVNAEDFSRLHLLSLSTTLRT